MPYNKVLIWPDFPGALGAPLGGIDMTSVSWRRGRVLRRTGTILLIACGVLMAVPLVGAARLPAASSEPGFVVPSLPLASGTSCSVGNGPAFGAYDPVDHYVYVPNAGSASLSILTGSCKVVTTVSFGTGVPEAAGFNPTNNRVYVTDLGRDQVYVISGTKLVTTITSTTFDEPYGVTFDPGHGWMAIANYGSDKVSFISGNSVVGTTTVGSAPLLLAYDPFFGRLLVSNAGSNNVTSMNATDPTDGRDNINIPVGAVPKGIAFDYADERDYVTNIGSNNVSVFYGDGAEVGSVDVGTEPETAVWDPATLSVDVVNYGSTNVSVIQGLAVIKTIKGVSGSGILGIEYDGATDQLFVTGYGNGKVYVYGTRVSTAGPVASGTSCATGTNPSYQAYDPVNHDVYVPNAGSGTVSILSGSCKVVATITSLPSGARPVGAGFNPSNNMVYVTDDVLDQVYVLLGTTLVTTITSSSFVAPLGVAFDPGDDVMAVANAGSNTVTFIFGTAIDGSRTVGSTPWDFAYDPLTGRFLVTNYGSDNVTSMNAVDPFVQSDYISIRVGSEPTGIAFDPASGFDYVANYASDNVTVINGLGHHFHSIGVGTAVEEVVWDQSKLEVYVANFGTSNVSVISGVKVARTITGPSGSGLLGMEYDAATDQVFVTGYENGLVYIYN